MASQLMDIDQIMPPKHMESEEWLEKVLARQRILFQEHIDQHHRAIAEVLGQVRDRLDNTISGPATYSRRVAPEVPDSSAFPGTTPFTITAARSTDVRMPGTAGSVPAERGPTSETSVVPVSIGRPRLSVATKRQPPSHQPSHIISGLSRQESQASEKSIHALVVAPEEEDAPATCRERIKLCMHGPIGHIVGICIVLNSISMFVHTEWLGSAADASLGIDTAVWRSPTIPFYITECFFCAVFTIELVLNCYAFRCDYFKSCFNILDSAIVLMTALEVFILSPLAMSNANVSSIRLLRIIKVARALKIVRTMSHFSSLRLLISSFIYSIASLFWSMVVMFLLILMCAIFLCQTLHEFIVDERNDLATRLWINNMYGSGHKAMYSVFEMTFSGCWPNYVRKLIEDVNPLYVIFFVIYITVIFFGMIRIISALFLKETLSQAARDAEMMVWERQKKGHQLKKELEALFEEADLSGDGCVALDEWDRLLDHPKVVLWLRELGIEAQDAHLLFDLLDDGDGSITKKEFVNGMSKLKGEARAQDLVPVAANCERTLAIARRTQNTCDRMEAILAEYIAMMKEEDAQDGSLDV